MLPRPGIRRSCSSVTPRPRSRRSSWRATVCSVSAPCFQPGCCRGRGSLRRSAGRGARTAGARGVAARRGGGRTPAVRWHRVRAGVSCQQLVGQALAQLDEPRPLGRDAPQGGGEVIDASAGLAPEAVERRVVVGLQARRAVVVKRTVDLPVAAWPATGEPLDVGAGWDGQQRGVEVGEPCALNGSPAL